jgi:hypothetical protein
VLISEQHLLLVIKLVAFGLPALVTLTPLISGTAFVEFKVDTQDLAEVLMERKSLVLLTS